MVDLVRVGGFLKALRNERGLSQSELGERLGVTNKTVSRWETGAYLPPADVLLRIGEFYGVSVNELLTGRRLTEDAEFRAAAEEHLTAALRSGVFSVKERLAYFQKKWLREHAVLLILLGALYGVLLAAAVWTRNMALICCAPLVLAVLHGWRNNAMMAYAERKVYDGIREEPTVDKRSPFL